ncbi:type II toxin-antitoxin system PrlF family antitoxin [Rhodopila globiformis]|uniref:AbrB family transcriptional regulator n=1 Tax=Rhodopila globiformis TaxID=1071 RepID=A0A2S6NJM1_RHOGL|nr:type II toxin-antitoxin system PrlF family antitoxin [Rhodopila globiformis]PPQ35096.1 AbrB family transcriptional regulator [Rhodopila globiformis]
MPIEEICTITAKGQTTVPKAVRKALGLGYGSRIAFRIEDGAVTVHAADDSATDPALAPFLELLAREIKTRPEAIVPLPADLVGRIKRLTRDIDVDPDAPIEGDVGL